MKHYIRKGLACVLILAVIFTLAGCNLLTDPKLIVQKGLQDTIAALKEVAEPFDHEAIQEMIRTAPTHQEAALYLKEANLGTDLSSIYGTGLKLSVQQDLPNRKMQLGLGLRAADYDVLDVGIAFVDDSMYLSCEDLLPDMLFGISADELAEQTGLDAAYFNVFEYTSKFTNANGKLSFSDKTKTAMQDALTALFDAGEWTKDKGVVNLTNGGQITEAKGYTLTLPMQSAKTFLIAIEEAIVRDELIESLLHEAGEIEEMDFYGELLEMIDEQKQTPVDANEAPLVISFAMKDGLIRRISTNVVVDGERVDISVMLGLGKNVADDFCLSVTTSEGSLEWKSTGQHVLVNGKFSDYTCVTVRDAYEDEPIVLEMNTNYDSNAGAYNWLVKVKADGEQLSCGSNGTLLFGKDTVDMTINELYVKLPDESGLTVNGSYHVWGVQNVAVDVSGAKSILSMSEDDMEELEYTLYENLYSWMETLMEKVPTFVEMLEDL